MKRSSIVMIAMAVMMIAMVAVASFVLRKPDPPDPDGDPVVSLPGGDLEEPAGEPAVVQHESEAFELVKDMKIGWNLGNALDSLDHQKRGINDTLKTMTPEVYYETYWGNPVTTQKVIDDVAAMGFGAVRVPITWQDHMNADLTIAPAWLDRVAEVVGYVLDNDMYCIINLHHDVGTGSWPWLAADLEKIDEHSENLRIVWEQIAVYFRDYDDKLLFQAFNEIQGPNGKLSDERVDCYEAVNELNQVFVDTVRATGGANAERFLVVNTYGAGNNSEIIEHFRIPEDTVEERLIASVHAYEPAGFTWTEDTVNWTAVYSEWDDEKVGREIDLVLERVRTNIVDQGIPVMIGEFGAWNKNNTPDRIAYAEYFVRRAAEGQMACFWWDEGGKGSDPEAVKSSALYDRYHEVWLFPELAGAMTEAAEKAWNE